MKKIKIHSFTDLITNSSTVIFTYSEGSDAALEEMINELFKTFGIDKTCKEVFNMVILCEDDYLYRDYINELSNEELPEGITTETDFNQLCTDVRTGKIEKPKWFKDVEENENDDSYYCPSTTLELIPKKEEYRKLADLITKFLYSTYHEATRDG